MKEPILRMKIIRLIEQGKVDREIVKTTGCHESYPKMIRRQLVQMTPEERQQEIEKAMAMKEDPEEKAQAHTETGRPVKRGPVKRKQGLVTPYTAARNGKTVMSNY